MVRGSGRGRVGYAGQSGRGGSRGRGRRRGSEHTGGFNLDWERQAGHSEEMTTFNTELPERFRGTAFKSPRPSVESVGRTTSLTINLQEGIRNYVRSSNITINDPKEAWRVKAEIPTGEELLGLGDEPIKLRPNKVKGQWKSANRYLETHYELLREDTVANLRDAVAAVRESPTRMDDSEISIYENVHIDGVTWAPQGLAFRVRFSIARANKSINWEYSKRLITGTLLALSPADDCFRTQCFPLVVAARPLNGVLASPPEVDIFFGSPKDIQIDPQQKFIMVEAKSGYFEATRHTLRAVQKLSTESFPLSDTICKLSNTIPPPTYLAKNPIQSLSRAYNGNAKADQAERVNLFSQWPEPTERTALDQSQWDALRTILTKSLAIVQGPPGTGKTHVSIVALKILIDNMSFDDPPIIVAAHTNHALDQLLQHLSSFLGEDYIRLGGRTKSPEIKKQSIFEVRQRVKVQGATGSQLAFSQRKLKDLTHRMIRTLSPMIREGQERPFSPILLEELGVITYEQRASLETGAAQWTNADEEGENEDPTSLWLSKALKTFEVVYKQPNFGFEEEEIDDLEYEQLKDLEAEHGVDEEDEFEHLKGMHRRIADRFTANGSLTGASRKEAEKILLENANLWKIPTQTRGIVYLLMQEKVKARMLENFLEQAEQYEELVQNLKIGKWQRDASILSKAKIIGMTTTGLSKYRPLVASLKPKIVLIEEAAECIEAPVTAACFDSLEHLILIGDHQQLQGSCADRRLSRHPYYLEVSMFERLVTNHIPYNTLTRQRRMDPEIRRVLQPIYGNKLQDHPSVQGRPSVPGMGDVRSFFFGHMWPESTDNQSSKYNENEADFIAGFFTYLTHNGVPPTSITVLTFYNGQRKLILKSLRRNPSLAADYLKVATVDSYQGEENAVVLLSLVRSNNYKDERSIGFLAIANRVCVALSRAKLGFYIFGNQRQLRRASPLWNDIIDVMQSNPNRVGHKLPLQCTNHGRAVSVAEPVEWNTIFGGCELRCRWTLRCGHTCPIRCHPFDHSIVVCKERCIRELPCGHACDRLCNEEPCSCQCQDFAKLSGPHTLKELTKRARDDDATAKQTEAWIEAVQPSDQVDEGTTDAIKGLPKPTGSEFAASANWPAIDTKAAEVSALRYDGGVSSHRVSRDKSSSASRYSPERQVTSRALWKEYAGGKVREDDRKREEDHEEAWRAALAAAEEQRADILIDLGGKGGVVSQKQQLLPNKGDGPQRTRYEDTWVTELPALGKPQARTSGVVPAAEPTLLD